MLVAEQRMGDALKLLRAKDKQLTRQGSKGAYSGTRLDSHSRPVSRTLVLD